METKIIHIYPRPEDNVDIDRPTDPNKQITDIKPGSEI